MLWAVFIILLILWLAAMVASYTLGGVIHLLLVLALLVLLAQVIVRKHKPESRTHEMRSKNAEPEQPEDKNAA